VKKSLSTVVKHIPLNPKVEGSSPAIATSTNRDKLVKKLWGGGANLARDNKNKLDRKSSKRQLPQTAFGMRCP